MAAADPRTPDDARPLFDDDGLFAGPVGVAAWAALLRRVEETLDADGWDQPARLYGLVNPVNTEAVLGTEARHIVADVAGRPDDAVNMVTTSCALTELGILEGHPADALWGQTMPPWTAAVVIAFEGWSAPKHILEASATAPDADPYRHLRNSQRPDRVEIRCVHMLTRSGTTYAVTRTRGEGVEDLHTPSTGGGYLIDVLARTLGSSTDPAPEGAGSDFLGRLALTTALAAVADLTGTRPDDNPTIPTPHLPALDEARAALTQLDADEREVVLTALFTRTVLAAVAHLSWKVTNHGKGPGVDIDLPLRRLVREAALRGGHGAEHLDAVIRAAGRCADLTLTDIAGCRRARDLVPPDVAANPHWADEGLLYVRLCLRQLPTQDDLFAAAESVCGPGLGAADSLLGTVGWRTRENPPT